MASHHSNCLPVTSGKMHLLFLLTVNIKPSLHQLFKSLTFIQTPLNNQHAISFITHFPKGGEKNNYNMPI